MKLDFDSLRRPSWNEILTPQEYDAAVRFGIWPAETPTPEEKVIYDEAYRKLDEEEARYRKAQIEFVRQVKELIKEKDEQIRKA